MTPLLPTRDAAIAWLRDKGLHAAARDWSFGKSICVGVALPCVQGDIEALQHLVCIHPEAGQWSITDLSGPLGKVPVTHPCGALEEAAAEALRLLCQKRAHESPGQGVPD